MELKIGDVVIVTNIKYKHPRYTKWLNCVGIVSDYFMNQPDKSEILVKFPLYENGLDSDGYFFYSSELTKADGT